MKKIILAVSCIAAFSCASNKVSDQRNPSQAATMRASGAKNSGKVICTVVNNPTGQTLVMTTGEMIDGAAQIKNSISDVSFEFLVENSKSLTLSATDKNTKYSASTTALNTQEISLSLGKDGRYERWVSCAIIAL